MGWLLAGMTVAKGVSDFVGAKAGEGAAKDAAKMEQLMTEESVRRLETDQLRDKSMLDVLQHGGGFSAKSVSNQLYTQEFLRLQQEEVDWLKLVGQSRYQARKAEAKAYKYQGYGSLANTATSAYTAYGK